MKILQHGLVKSPLAFKFYVQLTGRQNKINSGEFDLSPSMSLTEVVGALGKGPLELWVTIPEGLRREEIADVFANSLEKSAIGESDFRSQFLSLTEDKEGYLFPDTYLFAPEAGAQQVVNVLENTFETKVTQGLAEEIQKSKYSLDEVITMASILERETITDEERSIVAGVLWKRLETPGWLVQADATIQYVIGADNCRNTPRNCEDWWPILTRDDLDTNSPYNSYKSKPLPPTAIANPGLSSIEAAANPQSSEYWFYIHDSDSQIHFAEDINGHNNNVRKYLGK